MTLPMFTFDNTTPFSTHNPSADQPIMLANNEADQSIWATDHFGYNVNSGGYHQQVRMANRTSYPLAPNPPAVIAGFGGLYCDNTISVTSTNETGLWYTPDASGDIYQLTRTVTANYDEFGTFTTYPPPITNQAGGWTFLPGGLLFQYGTYNIAAGGSGSLTNVVFPIEFTNANSPFSLVVSGKSSNAFQISAQSTTGFSIVKNSISTGASFFWIAIGI